MRGEMDILRRMESAPQRVRQNHWAVALAALGLFGVTLWLFWPATGFDFLAFDDDVYVAQNPLVWRGLAPDAIRWVFSHVYENYWVPILWLSYMADSAIFGTGPFGYHLANLILHALNAALLFLVLRLWTKRVWLSLLVATLFAWHPLRTESVAWIAERKDVLSGCFVLLCFLAYGGYARTASRWRGLLAAFFLLLGLMTKPVLVTVPFVLLLLDYWPLGRLDFTRAEIRAKGLRLLSEKWFLWLLVAAFSALTYYTQHAGGAVHGVSEDSWIDRLADIPAVYFFYLKKLFVPTGLSMIYGELQFAPLELATAAVLLPALTVGLLWMGRRCRAVPVGWLWFLGMLVPVIGIVRVGTTLVADRFTYLPSIGLAIAVVWGVDVLAQRRVAVQRVAVGLALLASVACAWQTRAVLPLWQNSETAFANVLRYTPNSALANNNYGIALLESFKTEEALKYFQRAAALDRSAPQFAGNVAVTMILLDNSDDAIAYLQEIMTRFDSRDPLLNFMMGLALLEKKDPVQAIPFLERSIAGQDRDPKRHIELARAYMMAGRNEEVAREFAILKRIGGGSVASFEGMCNYYSSLWEKGYARRAWSFFEWVSSAFPDNAATLNNVAWLLAIDTPPGVSAEPAIGLARRAIAGAPEPIPQLYDTLAVAYAANGRFDDAIRWAEKAAALAQEQQQNELRAEIETRLQAYRDGKSWGRKGVRSD